MASVCAVSIRTGSFLSFLTFSSEVEDRYDYLRNDFHVGGSNASIAAKEELPELPILVKFPL